MNARDMVNYYSRVPDLNETLSVKRGPVIAGIRRRTLTIYWLIAAISIIPGILFFIFSIPVPAKVVACFLGLLLPGGGFIASGHVVCMIAGVLMAAFCFSIASMRFTFAGDKSWMILTWIIGILGGLFVHDHLPLYGPLTSVCAAAILWGYHGIKEGKLNKTFAAGRKNRETTIGSALKELDEAVARSSQYKEYESRELDEDGIAAMRTMFDITTRDLNDISGIETPKWCMGEFRYQLSYMGYSYLMLKQNFLPNFKGYFDHSMRYLINAFTTYESCGYWKIESLGGHGSFDFDPVSPRHHDNIMLKGWMAPILMGYGANFEGQEYKQEKSLKFTPYKDGHKTFDYSEDDIAKILINDFRFWKNKNIPMIPCEPHLIFTICNIYPMIGLIMYDRVNGTNYSESIFTSYINTLQQEMCEISGDTTIRRTNLLGITWIPFMNFPPGPLLSYNFISPLNAVYPGLSKRHYAFLRKELLFIDDEGVAHLNGIPWEKMIDFTNLKVNPAHSIGSIALCALEHGDYEMVEALRKAEKKYLHRSKNPNILKYKDCSPVSTTIMCNTHWARKNSWLKLTTEGTVNKGPVLTECAYPDVLVARATSSGQNLELVLYNGGQPGKQRCVIERLAANEDYLIEETGEILKSDQNGKKELYIEINGRTTVTIIPKQK